MEQVRTDVDRESSSSEEGGGRGVTGIEKQAGKSSEGLEKFLSPITPADKAAGDDASEEESDGQVSPAGEVPHLEPELLERYEDFATNEDDDKVLFVGDLGRDVTEEMLYRQFSQYGVVEKVDIKRDRETGRSLGYCFVHFETPGQADVARKQAHRTRLGSRPIRIGRARRNTSLYVPDLASSVNTRALRDAFRPFGEILEEGTYVVRHCYGFIRFKNRGDAEAAKQAMDGFDLEGRRIAVTWGEADMVRSSVQVQFDRSSETKLTRGALHSAFSKFGRVVAVDVPADAAGKTKGVAFVQFEESDAGYIAATNAIKKVTSISGLQVWCHHGRQLQPVTKNLQKSLTTPERPRYPGPSSSVDERSRSHAGVPPIRGAARTIASGQPSAPAAQPRTPSRAQRSLGWEDVHSPTMPSTVAPGSMDAGPSIAPAAVPIQAPLGTPERGVGNPHAAWAAGYFAGIAAFQRPEQAGYHFGVPPPTVPAPVAASHYLPQPMPMPMYYYYPPAPFAGTQPMYYAEPSPRDDDYFEADD